MRTVACAALLLVFAVAQAASADTASYRALGSPPLPPPPPGGLPPAPPSQPCDLVLNCSPLGIWLTSSMPGWATGVAGQAGPWQGQVVGWAATAFPAWAAGAVVDEFSFLGPGGATTATIHVHDALGAPLEGNNLFVVKGGVAGERWVCKHSCTVPDTGFTVSVDPLDVPLNIWLGFESAFPLPNLPSVSGTITVTFS